MNPLLLIDRPDMLDSSLPFELTTVLLLVVMGCVLLLFGLPGFGLISTALLLAVMSIGLRMAGAKERSDEVALIPVREG
jgi:hypothetical protein